MAVFELDKKDLERLQTAMQSFPKRSEAAINEVFHGEAVDWLDDSIRQFMPVSGKTWKGKKPAAKSSKSLADRDKNSNLSVTIGTKPNWHYLYFPDDGSNTRRHVGNQQFFKRGAEAAKDRIIDRCITKITTNLNEGV